MKLEPAQRALCQQLVTQVLAEVSPALREKDAQDVIGPLARCANRLHDEPPAPAEEIALLLRTATGAALGWIARGHLGWSQWQALEAAYNATLERPPEDNPLHGFLPEPPPDAPRFALFSPPRSLWLHKNTIALTAELRAALNAQTEASRTEYQEDLREDQEDEAFEAEAADSEALESEVAPTAPSEQEDTSTPPSTPSPSTPSPSAPSSGGVTLYDPTKGLPPPVRLEKDRAPSIPIFRLYAQIAEEALDTMALLNRHRLDRAIEEAHDEETRIWELLDGALTTGPDLIENTEHWWAENLDSPDEWKVWAPCYVLGSLEEQRAPLALDRILNDLDPETPEQVLVAAQGLHQAQGSGLGALRRELRRSSNPRKRAVGVEVSSLAKELTADDLGPLLCDPNPIVASAALRAAARQHQLPVELQDRLVLFLHTEQPELVREAARALLLHSRPEPYLELQHGKLEQALGAHLLEFLVWTGSEHDIPRIQQFVQTREISGRDLLWLGQFGHPAMWAFLAHYLGDEDLQDSAADALTLLLGDQVDEDERFHPGEWERALGRVAPDAGTRYRLGKPFRAASVIEEYQARKISYRTLEARLLEVAIRSGQRVDVELVGWVGDCEGRLQPQLMTLQRTNTQIRPGSWDSRGRG